MKKILFTLTMLLSLGSTLGIKKATAESVLYPDWTHLSAGSSSGRTLSAGRYYVDQNITFSNVATGSGLTIASGATVYIYIPAGVTLTATGGNADGKNGAGAGIELPQGSTLYLMGKGRVVATGGRAANGGNGGGGSHGIFSEGDDGDVGKTGGGGYGGGGGGGAGAGIGTRGGTGGSGANGHDDEWYYSTWTDPGENGNSGSSGGTASSMGTLYVDNDVTLTATGGSKGSNGTGGSCGQSRMRYGYREYSVCGGGGGGAGGFGGAASDIGTGGCGGGGGGSGAKGGIGRKTTDFYYIYAGGGSGGKNGDGTDAPGGGSAAVSKSAISDGRCSTNAESSWVSSASEDDFDGNRKYGGSGGGRGSASVSRPANNNFLVKLNVMNAANSPVQDSKTIGYKSNESSGSAQIIIPTNYQLGLINSDKYVSKWYANNSCTGSWKAAYDELSIGSGNTPVNYYGVWQNYSDQFEGAGTKDNPFIITAENMEDFANYVNDGGNTRGLYFKQQGDINVSNIMQGNWTPIGLTRVFEGDYDGDGNRITNASIPDRPVLHASGIFGKVSGSIHNLGVENCVFNIWTQGETYCGIVAGMLLRCDMEQPTTAEIRNCYVANNRIAANRAGGLVGTMSNASVLSHCVEANNSLITTYTSYDWGGLADNISSDCVVVKCFTNRPSFSRNSYTGATNSEKNINDSRMKSGAIAWLLNDDSPYGGPWYQNLQGTIDACPVLDKQHLRVYYSSGTYSNSPAFDGLNGITGHGTVDNPFLITSKADLQSVASFCNSGKNSAGMHFLQTADININESWSPIHPFAGTYNGGGHTIRNASIASTAENRTAGLFGLVRGTVTRLCAENITVTGVNGDARIGAIAGRLAENGSINNCFVKSCTITSNLASVVGAIVGDIQDQSSVRNCLTLGNTLSGTRTGHICSDMKNSAAIYRCYTNGSALVSEQNGCTITESEPGIEEDILYSGEITYKLNNSVETLSPAWFQNIDIEGVQAEATPVLATDHAMVFKRGETYTNDYAGIGSLGQGTEQSPYLVGSAADLKKISYTFATMRYSNFYVRQTANIDMAEKEPIVPIGIGTSGFAGHYDGGGFVISNLFFSDYQGESLGLFNNIIGTVERLGIENSTFWASDANNRVGAFAGKITGTGKLLNCYAAGSTVNFNSRSGVVVGALVGELADQSSIVSCYGYKNTVVGQNDGGNKHYGYITGNIGSNATATRVFTDGASLCADGQSGAVNITASERNVTDLRFKTGEMTYLLNGEPAYDAVAASVWRQNIKTDLVPVLTSGRLAVWKYTNEANQTMYTNSNEMPATVALTLNPNYKDYQGNDVDPTVVNAFKATDSYYVPKLQLENYVPLRNHYYLAGWNTEANGKGTHYDRNDEILLSVATLLYAQWDVMVPDQGEFTARMPAGTTSIKIYDGGGYNTPYGINYGGKLTLQAPDNQHIIYLTGTVATEALDNGQARDYLIVRNGGTNADQMSNDQSVEVAGKGPVFVSTTDGTPKNIGRLLSSGEEITIEFYSDGQKNFTGLNLTATIISKDINEIGLGTVDNPFEVAYAGDLKVIEEYIKATHNTEIYIRQVEDIDLSELEEDNATIAPLAATEPSFAGHYDGCGYTIKNGTIASTDGTKVGLFANLTGTVTRLCMENITVSYNLDNAEAGAIAGRLGGEGCITNCRVKGITIQNNNHTGGSEGAVAGAKDNTAAITGCLVLNTDKACCGNASLGEEEDCYKDPDLFSMKSGQTCYLLNDNTSNNTVVWRQTIGTDDLPKPDSNSSVVYYQDEQNHQGYTNEETPALATLRVQDIAFNAQTDHQAIKGSMVRLATYTPVHAGLTLVEWNSGADFSGTSYTPEGTLVLSADATVLYPRWNVMPQIIAGEGTAESPFIIASTDDWNALASNVTYFDPRFQGYAGKHIRLDADINVTQKIGTVSNSTQGNAFCGTFDGNGHSINATITDTENQGTAPFCYILNATIKNLTVNGTIGAGEKQHAAALVGFANGTCRIENCKVTADVNGGTHIGGILGHGLAGNITISGCLYSGTMTGGATAKGVIVGWGDSGTKTITNCLYLMPENQNTTGLDLARRNGGNISVNNSYKTTSAGTYGVQGFDITEGEVCQKLITLFGYTVYAQNPCAVTGINANYDMRTAAVSITPVVTAPNSAGLTLGNDYTATLNGEAVTQYPIAIDEVGDYTLVFTGTGSYEGSKTCRFQVIGDHVIITLTEDVGTYSCDEDLNFTGSDLRAYIAAGYNKGENQVLLVHITDVPAGTGIFVRGQAGESYNIPKSSSQSYYVNMLKANLTAGPIAATADGMSNFLLAKVDDVFKFCTPSANATLGANKAYLQVPTTFMNASAREVDILFEEDATGIRNLTSALSEGEGAWYDVQGRLVTLKSLTDTKPMKKGLYIHNGKKVVIK